MQTIRVRTTQNVFIDYPIASLGDRILAYLMDTLIQIAYIILCYYVLEEMKFRSTAVNIMIVILPYLLYHGVFEILMNGQSPGKKQMKIKVVRMDGTSPTLGNYLMRWMFRLVEVFLLQGALAMTAIAANGKGQRLGDLVAGTSVVKLMPQGEVKSVFTPIDDNHVPTFPQASSLSDHDIELIYRALAINRDTGNPKPMNLVLEKVKALLGLETDLPPTKFLYTLIKDYAYYSSQHG